MNHKKELRKSARNEANRIVQDQETEKARKENMTLGDWHRKEGILQAHAHEVDDLKSRNVHIEDWSKMSIIIPAKEA